MTFSVTLTGLLSMWASFLPGGGIEISTAFQSGQRRGASCAKTRIQTGNMAKSNYDKSAYLHELLSAFLYFDF
jgi:hypothetical protein